MLYLEKKYMNLLSGRLKHFKWKGGSLWNFRCPYCGDSHKNDYKARGYVFEKKGKLFYKCHNCGQHKKFVTFLKEQDPMLYSEFLMEELLEEKVTGWKPPSSSDFVPTFEVKLKLPERITLPTIESLPENHYAKRFLLDRLLPRERLKDLYFAADFNEFVKEVFPNANKELKSEPRIVIPFRGNDRFLLGVQGRSLTPSKSKYITVKADEDAKKIYGWDRVDPSKRIYVVEGPIDSMFLQNSVATMDASLYNAPFIMGLQESDFVFIYDNEPRNPQINKNIRTTIEKGYKVCIWPSNIREKDINEMVLAGRSPAAVQHIIDQNTFSGMQASLNHTLWSKL